MQQMFVFVFSKDEGLSSEQEKLSKQRADSSADAALECSIESEHTQQQQQQQL